MKYINIFLISCFIYSCGDKKSNNQEKNGYLEGNSKYKYEYRTNGESYNDEYHYNYDVSGEDEYGNNVTGNVDTEGKYGSGTIIDDDGNEREVETEWVDYGVMEATDKDGNTYTLEVD